MKWLHHWMMGKQWTLSPITSSDTNWSTGQLMPSPATREEQPHAPVQAVDCLAGKHSDGEGPGKHQADMSQQCPLAAKEGQPGAALGVLTADWGKWSSPSAQHWQHLSGMLILFWTPQYKTDMNILEWAHKKATEMTKVSSNKGRLKELEKCLGRSYWWGCGKDWAVPSKSSGHKPKQYKFHLNIYIHRDINIHTHCKSDQTMEQFTPRGSVISLEMFKTPLEIVLSNLL